MQTEYSAEIAEINIAELIEGEAVNAFELGYFLYYFRAAYVACLDTIQLQAVPFEQIESLTRKDLLGSLDHDVPRLWLHELSEEYDLEFISISKQSPLKFVSRAAGVSLVALSMAVILSGGKANIYTGQFELPPLAHGIRELKEAFGHQPPRSLPSEKRTKRNNIQKPRGPGG